MTGSFSRRMLRLVVIAALALLYAVDAPGQAKPPDDKWARVRFLMGSWEGTTEGQPGQGTVRRRYGTVLKDQFIEVRNTSTYPPQEKNPKGEVHEDVGFISVDRARKRLVLRQFHVEGFVNQYVEAPSASSGTLLFMSEAIENSPAGFRARETYTMLGADEFEEVFEIAEPGQAFEVYSRAKFRRAK